MNTTNSIFTVTPPDFKLNHTGPIVLLLGVTLDNIEPYSKIYDNLFPDIEIVYMVTESGVNQSNLAWLRAAAGMANSVFVNLDNLSLEELFIAMQLENSTDNINMFWLSEIDRNENLRRLLNSYQYSVFDSLDSVQLFLEKEYANYG